jgi:hypothetical protein
MRHLRTLIAAVVITPLAWVLLAYGQDRSLQAFLNEEDAGSFSNGDFIRPALCLGAAGLLLGLLGTLRISPVGAVLTGLLYTGSYLAMLLDPDAVLSLLPGEISLAGREADMETPLRTGSAMVLGAVLLLALVSRSRWRRAPDSQDEPTDDAPLAFGSGRPLGADGLGLSSTPVSGELIGAASYRDSDPDAGPGWSQGPDWGGRGRPNERADGPVPAGQRQGHWQEMARDTGPESRRWPTIR